MSRSQEGSGGPKADRSDRVIEDRAIHVFLSPTFADMQSEREELIKQVFPQVRRICEDRGIGWSYVDLRWGIPEERVADGTVLPLCFAEIDRCRPFFIGILLLGERYGTVPIVPTALLDREPWMRNYSDASVTELEIRHAVLNSDGDGQPYAFFYFRNSSPHPLIADGAQVYAGEMGGCCEGLLSFTYPYQQQSLHRRNMRYRSLCKESDCGASLH